MSKLIPMTQPEYDEYLKQLIPDYAADNVRAGYWDESEALEKSRKQLRVPFAQAYDQGPLYL